MRPVTKMMVKRIRLGISQARLATEIGVTQPRISQWETRVIDMPKRRRIQIAAILQMDHITLTDDA